MTLTITLKNSKYALKVLLVALGVLYVIASMLPKHGDYWTIVNISMGFAVNPADFMTMKYANYPPIFHVLQGVWLKAGASLFHYNLTFNANLGNSTLYRAAGFGIFPFWGMIPILAALFLLVGASYTALHNKWLSLFCFGPITFVAVIFMGQIDVFCALFIFVSLLLMQKALNAKKYASLLILAYLSLGISMQFKTYGGALLPIFLIYTVALVKGKKLDFVKSSFTVLTCLAAFAIAVLIVWIPYLTWVNKVMFGGTSFWLNFPSPLFTSQVPVWLIGYVFILCYTAVSVLGKPEQALKDKRYFAFYSFAVAAWFFIAVETHPQWWMFLVPVALLALDNFQNKSGVLLCVVISAIFFLYPLHWGAIAELYPFYFDLFGITARYPVPAFIAKPSFAWIHMLLTASLLLWIWVMARELRNRKQIQGKNMQYND